MWRSIVLICLQRRKKKISDGSSDESDYDIKKRLVFVDEKEKKERRKSKKRARKEKRKRDEEEEEEVVETRGRPSGFNAPNGFTPHVKVGSNYRVKCDTCNEIVDRRTAINGRHTCCIYYYY